MNGFTAAAADRCQHHPENCISIYSLCVHNVKYNNIMWIFYFGMRINPG